MYKAYQEFVKNVTEYKDHNFSQNSFSYAMASEINVHPGWTRELRLNPKKNTMELKIVIKVSIVSTKHNLEFGIFL